MWTFTLGVGGAGNPGGAGRPGRPGSPALASLIPKVLATAVIISMERIIFLRIMAPFSMVVVFDSFEISQSFQRFRTLETKKPGLKYMIFRQPGYLVETQ
jgi:hypothetical protein